METRFGVEVPNLSRWRRDTCGDLTATLGLGERAAPRRAALPDSARRAGADVEASCWTSAAGGARAQSMPVPEARTRPRRGRQPA